MHLRSTFSVLLLSSLVTTSAVAHKPKALKSKSKVSEKSSTTIQRPVKRVKVSCESDAQSLLVVKETEYRIELEGKEVTDELVERYFSNRRDVVALTIGDTSLTEKGLKVLAACPVTSVCFSKYTAKSELVRIVARSETLTLLEMKSDALSLEVAEELVATKSLRLLIVGGIDWMKSHPGLERVSNAKKFGVYTD